MRDIDMLQEEYDKLTDRKMPSELRSKIYSMIGEHANAEPDSSPKTHRKSFGWLTGAVAVVAAVCITAVITVGVVRHGTQQHTTAAASSVENAVQQNINKVEQPFLNKYKPGTVEKVTHNTAFTPNGDFVATQTITPKGTTYYSIFYASQMNGKWDVQFAGIKYDPKSNPLPASIQMNKGNRISCIGIGVPKNLSITNVIVHVRFTQKGKDVPLSLTKIGSLPLWVYNLTADKLNYPSNGAMVWMDSVTAYNRAGDVVWSRHFQN